MPKKLAALAIAYDFDGTLAPGNMQERDFIPAIKMNPEAKYGDISKAFISIQQSLLVLEQQGGKHLFGEPALKVGNLMRVARDGRGYISILSADALLNSPRLYAVFLLFLLSELFNELPEVGALDKPKLIFFFDEAHLLFNDAPKSLLQMVERLLQLIGSKGVGVYFVTENPLEMPDRVSSELGHRVQHRVPIFTRKQQIAAAKAFRANPAFDTQKVTMELGVGEALVSTLDMRSQPTMVARTLIRPPSSRIGPITEVERRAVIRSSPVAGEYDQTVIRDCLQVEAPVLSDIPVSQCVNNRDSSFGILQKRIDTLGDPARYTAPPTEAGNP